MTQSLSEVVEVFGAITYPVPRSGEHGSLSCLLGRHWWAIVRSSEKNKAALAVTCGACCKILPIHDLPGMEAKG